MTVTIDKFEYATDEAAQAAWGSCGGLASGLPPNTKLFVGFQQLDAVFIDEGSLGQTLTNNGVEFAASGKYYGAGVFDGGSDNISVPANAALDPGTGDFCFSGYFYLTLGTGYYHLLGTIIAGDFMIALNYPATNIAIGRHNITWDTATSYTFSSATWYHIEVSRTSGRVYFFVNGTLLNSGGTANTQDYNTDAILIGEHSGSGSTFNGKMSEFCYQVGTGGHTSNFTPPISYISPLIPVSSESTIKHEGSYSTKVVAPQTTSLNKTLTRTVSPTINLTDQANLKIWVRASRTGTNLKIGFHDSGGTTTESNIAISSADTFEEKTIDISAVANANKDAIDSIIITITNADAENTIYLDEMLGYVTDEGTGGGGMGGIFNSIVRG